MNGSKTFITNGINADLVITAVKTDRARSTGHGACSCSSGAWRVRAGRNLEKVGLHAQDTAELFFTDVHVPAANLLGEEGQGFLQLVHNLPQGVCPSPPPACPPPAPPSAGPSSTPRPARPSGQPIGSFQNSRSCSPRWPRKSRSARPTSTAASLGSTRAPSPPRAAMAKWWCTELQKRVVDKCVQLHGGYGYMLEYPIARAYADARITTIYGAPPRS